MGRHGLSTFSWVFCQGAGTPSLHLFCRHFFAPVKFGRVPPSPPLRQQEGMDEAAIFGFRKFLILGQVGMILYFFFNIVVLRPGRLKPLPP